MEQNTEPKEFKLLPIFSGLFVATLILSTIASSKLFTIGLFTLPGGVIIFPIAFIFNDILTEVYGYARCRKIVWTGLVSYVLLALTLLVVDILPPASFWPNQIAFHSILGFVPRVALAGILAYFFGEISNSIVLSKMKYWEKGERGLKQGWRFLMSTIVGEGVDSIIFMTVAFAGTIPPTALMKTILTLYVVKVIYELIAIPISTRFANRVKQIEGTDKIDYPDRTNYNPFAFLSSKKSLSEQ